ATVKAPSRRFLCPRSLPHVLRRSLPMTPSVSPALLTPALSTVVRSAFSGVSSLVSGPKDGSEFIRATLAGPKDGSEFIRAALAGPKDGSEFIRAHISLGGPKDGSEFICGPKDGSEFIRLAPVGPKD